MEINEVVSLVKSNAKAYDIAAVEFCLKGEESTRLKLLAELKAYLKPDFPKSGEIEMFPIFAILILGHLKEKRLHPILLELLNLPEKHPLINELGDYLTESLYVQLYHTSLGDFTGIRKVLANRETWVHSRWVCLKALEAAAAYGDISHESLIQELLGYLKIQLDLFKAQKTLGYSGSDSIFSSALLVSLKEANVTLENEWVREALDLDILETMIIDRESFKTNRRDVREDSIECIKQDCETNVYDSLDFWYFNGLEEMLELALAAEPPKAQKKKQKIGRNEVCPCGSGIKYKKCCLTAEL